MRTLKKLLTFDERQYLKETYMGFRKRIESITFLDSYFKIKFIDTNYTVNSHLYSIIGLDFKNCERNKEYTLDELGI